MPKVALIVYYSNPLRIYPEGWIDEFKASIERQTATFDIIELNYGDDPFHVFCGKPHAKKKLNNHAEAQNELLDWCFKEGYDYVCNSNLDDFYHRDYVKLTVQALEQGFDVVSCNFSLIDEDGILTNQHKFHHRDIKFELSRDHNIIAHPAVGYSKNFWEGNRYDPGEIPCEDLRLWQRALKQGVKFHILAENLLYHRVHKNAVSYKPQGA